MYIMCVCLFSALSRRVGALQISIIIIIIINRAYLCEQDLDEINQELTFSAFLYLDWIDNRLSWTPSNYNNTMYFSFPQSEIWIPDVTIQNSVETMSELGFDRNYM